MANPFKDWTFKQMHGNNLVYNQCWEDPRCDRELMSFDKDSKVLMITSAGDNALDYLLDDVASVDCVDLNFRQNALLDLKKAAFERSSHGELFRYFGEGYHPQAREVYEEQLRPGLATYAQDYWDKRIRLFKGKGMRKSFYYRGTSGAMAWMTTRFLKMRKKLYRDMETLMASPSIPEQALTYARIEPRLFNRVTTFTVSNRLSLMLTGVPNDQYKMLKQYPGGPGTYIKDMVRGVFTERELKDNYFWQLYYQGYYTPDCCPNYLKESNFDYLKARMGRVRTHTTSYSQFLKDHPGQYTHFVLLDHQDWLTYNDRPALEEEWKLILANAAPGARILLRTNVLKADFIPDFVHEQVHFESDELASVHSQDRVGTYASVYRGTVLN